MHIDSIWTFPVFRMAACSRPCDDPLGRTRIRNDDNTNDNYRNNDNDT